MQTVYEAECKIEVYGNVQQLSVNGHQQEYLNVQVQLFEGTIDEQHDLLYLLKRNDSSDSQDSTLIRRQNMPASYKELDINYVIRLTKSAEGFGQGQIVISNLPPGRYKIYYLKPCEPQRILKSANVKLRKVGHGQEFNIWYVSKSSQLSCCQSQNDSIPISITSDQVRAANSRSVIDAVRLMNFHQADNSQDQSLNDTPRVIEQMSESENAEILDNQSLDSLDVVKPIHSDLLINRTEQEDIIHTIDEPAIDSRMEACKKLLQTANPLHSRIKSKQRPAQIKQVTEKVSYQQATKKSVANQKFSQLQELARKQNLQNLRSQLQKDFKEQQLKLSQSHELMKSTRNNRLGKILLSNQNILSTVEEIESSNMSQTTLLRDACAAFRGNTSSKSKVRNSSLMQLASNQKYSGSQICEEGHMTTNSISGELLQLMCQETIPVNEESDSDDVEDIFLRVTLDNKRNIANMSSEETTRTNSHIGSLLIPHSSNSNIQMSIEQSETSVQNKKALACKPFKENNESQQVQRQRIARKPDTRVVRKKAALNAVKKFR